MANLDFNNGDSSKISKLNVFDQSASVSAGTGQKIQYSEIPAFYLGGGVKEHFPYVKDRNGKKIPKKGGSTRYTEYERETTSDGWIFSLYTPGKDKLYVVTREKPALEVGSFYLASGLGYGHGQYPTFLDESIKLERSAHLVALDSEEVVVNEED